MVKLLGSNSDQLITYDDLLSEQKRCGMYALWIVPLYSKMLYADNSELSKVDEMFDKRLEHDRRLAEVFEDIINLGYCQSHNF